MTKAKGLKYLLIILTLLMILNPLVWAAEIPDYSGDIYVQDFANLISSQMENQIRAAAGVLEDNTSAQISIVTVESLEGNDIETYGNEMYRSWGIGDKEKENGLLLLVANQEQKFRIEVGYGLEGRINDAKAGEILRSIGPYFQKGDFDSGIALAFNQLVEEVNAEYAGTSKVNKTVPENENVNIPWWAQIVLIGMVIYLAIFHPELLMTLIYLFSRGGVGSGGSRKGGGGSSGGGGASGGW